MIYMCDNAKVSNILHSLNLISKMSANIGYLQTDLMLKAIELLVLPFCNKQVGIMTCIISERQSF